MGWSLPSLYRASRERHYLARNHCDERARPIMKAPAILLALVLAFAADTTQAQDYPARPVTFVVPFAPGGVTSLFARLLSQKLEQQLGKPFIVENRPGGGGVTAATQVAHAPP